MVYTTFNFIKDLDSPYAWPGGYPRFFVMADGEAMSFESAKKNKNQIIDAILDAQLNQWPDKQWQIVGTDINWEDAELFCCESGEKIESAYGD